MRLNPVTVNQKYCPLFKLLLSKKIFGTIEKQSLAYDKKEKSININFKGILKVGILLIIFLGSNTIKPKVSNNSLRKPNK